MLLHSVCSACGFISDAWTNQGVICVVQATAYGGYGAYGGQSGQSGKLLIGCIATDPLNFLLSG